MNNIEKLIKANKQQNKALHKINIVTFTVRINIKIRKLKKPGKCDYMVNG